jgi:hypothetical protein
MLILQPSIRRDLMIERDADLRRLRSHPEITSRRPSSEGSERRDRFRVRARRMAVAFR